MSFYRNFAFATVSLLALSAPAYASDVVTKDIVQNGAGNGSGDIVVEARRKSERLQDVPKSVDAVTAADLRNNNVQKFDDVASLVPGLDIQNSGNAEVQDINIRGTNFNVDTGLQDPTVQLNLNDANINGNELFQSFYDIGQIEVLRGPQGTLRGRSAPSGSITITTHKPDLYKWGGYVESTDETTVNGMREAWALNVPVISGVLAVRVAGVVDDNQGNNIRSVSTVSGTPSLYPEGSYNRIWSNRISVRFQPVESIEANVMYQRTVNRTQANLQTESTCLIDSTQPCGPGPLITVGDRLSTVNGQRETYANSDVVTANVDWHVLGQKLSYTGLYDHAFLYDQEPQDGANYFNNGSDGYPGNPAVYTGTGFGAYSTFTGLQNPYSKTSLSQGDDQSHEIRLASENRIFGIFDYVIGANMIYRNTFNYYSGAAPIDYATSTITAHSIGNNGNDEWSIFGNITAHPTEKLEISGGLRRLVDKTPVRSDNLVWSASASYHFDANVMAYVNAGSSFRPGGENLGLYYTPFQMFVNAPAPNPGNVGCQPIPAPCFTYGGPSAFYQIAGEKATSIEVGFKSQFMDKRLTVNADYFHQAYSNYQYTTAGYIEYLAAPLGSPYGSANSGQGPIAAPLIGLGTASVPATIQGVEGDITYRYSHAGSIGAVFSYVDGKIDKGGLIPCPLNSAADTHASQFIGVCPGGTTSFAPRFEATVHADYAHPITDSITGFVRGQFTFHGATPFDVSLPYDKQPAYGILNVYWGVRSATSNWEATLFVQNLTNNQTRLATFGGNINANTPGYAGQPGVPGPTSQYSSYYTYVGMTQPRTFGLTLRYAFGSR